MTLPNTATNLAVSSVRDSKTGDVILKFVNVGAEVQPLKMNLSGAKKLVMQATRTVLTGELMAVNAFGKPAAVVPQTSSLTVGEKFDCELPAHSLTVIRMATR